MLSRKTLPILHGIDRPSFQSLLNYSSSRVQAAALSYLISEESLTAEESQKFQEYLTHELLFGMHLLGLGMMLHPNSLSVPRGIQACGHLFVADQLTLKPKLRDIILDNSDPTDTVLEGYALNWWAAFPPPDGFNLDLSAIIDA
ncbi:hypothetical protein H1R20_g1178, partial [Candolleomyces eurysporus]